MEVRAGGAAAAADLADHIALVDHDARLNAGREAIEMGVGGLDLAAMVDHQIATVASEPVLS